MAEGYEYIGMDHFALPHDELARVKKEGQLHRNFQGYHTLKDCDLIGFGVSAISEVGLCYSQNLKTVDTYSQALSLGQSPIEKALELNEDDQLRRQVIMSLMCQGRVDKLAIEQQFGIQFNDYFTDALDRLTEFEDAGLLSVSDTLIEVNEAGWFVIRAIAMAFDYYLWHETDHRRFSKVL
jgi:oxygen-independent coproporphyrinogen-3 oxidase